MSRPVRLVVLVVLLAAAGAAARFAYLRTRPPGPDTAAAPPGKLVVLVVFDQMRGDYLDRWAQAFGTDGFERMKKDGVWYPDCHLPYACSSTGPGHASIVTGAPPAAHGIIENEWFDRTAGKEVYCVQPLRPYERVPPSKAGPPRDQADGIAPDRLLAPTVGDALQAHTGGKGRVFSLSIKDRTAVLMGGKRPDGVYCFDNRNGEFYTSAYYRDAPHPWVTEFNGSGAAGRWFGGSWQRFKPDPALYDRLAGPDDAAGESYGRHGQGRVFPHPMKGKDEGAPGPQYYTILETSPFGSEFLLEFVKKAVTAEKLGQGETADLLCVSFSSTDLVGHQWGPDSHEVLDVTLRSDRIVAELLKFLDESLGKDRYTVVLTADHGVCPLPEGRKAPGALRVKPDDLFGPLAAALDDTYGKGTGNAPWFEAVSWPSVYLNRRALADRKIPAEQAADFVGQWLGNRQPYMEAGFTRRQIEAGTFPAGSVGDKVRLAYHPDRCGDVIAVTKPYVLVTTYDGGTSHGSPHPYDTHVPVLVYGAGVPALGKRPERVSSLVVAPTLAWALGVPPPAAAAERVPAEIRVK